MMRKSIFFGMVAAAFALQGASDPYAYKELVEREVRPVKTVRNAAGHVSFLDRRPDRTRSSWANCSTDAGR